jgi:hypothetical protein
MRPPPLSREVSTNGFYLEKVKKELEQKSEEEKFIYSFACLPYLAI